MTVKNHGGWKAALAYMSELRTPGHYDRPGLTRVCDGGLLVTSHQANYLTVHSKGTQSFYKIGTSMCHASMGNVLAAGLQHKKDVISCQYVVSSLWTRKDAPASQVITCQRWFDYIFSKDESPFRMLFPNDGDLELHGTHPQTGKPTFITLKVSEQTNLQILMSFLIATRFPFEKVGKLDLWVRLVDRGVDKALATYLMHAYSNMAFDDKNDKVTTTFDSIDITHGFINSIHTENTVARLKHGKPKLNSERVLYNSNSYGPLNSIWSDNKISNHVDPYRNFLKEMKSLFGHGTTTTPNVADVKPRKHYFENVSKKLRWYIEKAQENITNSQPPVLSISKLVNYKVSKNA